ncbi:potassium channel subfamily K member 7 [Microcaecilia unicolor]|uniref:Potassium channel subfamily K member n=1 Tax=Microcaecilia unicolor TaxID=1415580 RepID=A0A6P7ZE33_9AMPH|nr:potassium channel subfamily K member 7 [Microcaecilia unicolor]
MKMVRTLDVPKLPHSWNYVILLCGYFLFLVFGAMVFGALEQQHEMGLRRQVAEARSSFILGHACISDNGLQSLLEQVLAADNYGVSALENISTSENWSFSSSLFFVTTVLTTTGYGHTVPLSDGGKIFCILYTILGIPVTLFFLAFIIRQLTTLFTVRPLHYAHVRWGFPQRPLAVVHVVLLVLTVTGFFILLPATIFWAVEDDWNYLESIYFCFISLSTIGLGDYIPGKASNPLLKEFYKFSITCYLIIGLVAMLVALESLYRLQEVRRFFRLFCSLDSQRSRKEDLQGILSQDELSVTEASGTLPIVDGP